MGNPKSSLNARYVMWANSSALTLRLVSQSSFATLPFDRRSSPRAVLSAAAGTALGWKNGRL